MKTINIKDETHEALKIWCKKHGCIMSAIIDNLVRKFMAEDKKFYEELEDDVR